MLSPFTNLKIPLKRKRNDRKYNTPKDRTVQAIISFLDRPQKDASYVVFINLSFLSLFLIAISNLFRSTL
jgi:hypothetical protein